MSKRILIADDDQDSLDLYVFVLSQNGNVIYPATDGISAYKIASETPCDMAFLDYDMPGMDGIDLARQLFEKHGYTPEKLVMMTARDRLSINQKAAEKGVVISDYFSKVLQKPFNTNDLVSLL